MGLAEKSTEQYSLPYMGNSGATNYTAEIVFRIAVFVIFVSLEVAPPFTRVILPEEVWLYQYPRVSQPFLSDLGGPFLKLLLDPLPMVLYPLLAIFVTWHYNRNTRELCQMYLIPTLSIPLTGLIINFIKITVGRPRPNFMATCYGPYYYLKYSDASYPCTAVESYARDSRKSFPSGHSGLACASFGFLVMYVAEKAQFIWSDSNSKWKVIATFLPLLMLPVLVGISRTCDYKHHWQDVVVGGMIGMLVTYFVYKLYSPGAEKNA